MRVTLLKVQHPWNSSLAQGLVSDESGRTRRFGSLFEEPVAHDAETTARVLSMHIGG
jgi:hypothetical protein